MIIEYKRFKLEPTVSNRFNLTRSFTKRVQKFGTKEYTGETREETEDMGYDMTFEKCLNEILHWRLRNKQETTDLKGFIKEFKKEKEELINTLKLD